MAGGVKFPTSTIEDSWNTFRKSIDSGTDLDNLRDSNDLYGFYSWGGSNPTNAPDSYMVLIAMNDSNQGLQIAWGTSSIPAKVYVRRANSGVWTGWTSI